MKATEDQINRITLEGWSLTEIAARAGVDRSTVVRWASRDYSAMPYHTAAALVRQADGDDPLPSHAAETLTRLAAYKVRRSMHV